MTALAQDRRSCRKMGAEVNMMRRPSSVLLVTLTAVALSLTAPGAAVAVGTSDTAVASPQDLGGSTAKYIGRFLSPGICAVKTTDYASQNGYNWWHCEPVTVSGARFWYGYVAHV